MSRIDIITAAIVLLLAGTTPVHAQGAATERHTLNQDVEELYQQGRYVQATILAKRALEDAQAKEGPDHLEVARSLNNLALLYATQGEYAKAEPLYKRALAIREKALGPEPPSVASSLNNLA
jgi:tetratricopeptide (TPR) repeat protein